VVGDHFRADAVEVSESVFSLEVEGGSLRIALHEDGSVRVDGPRGPEIVTVWEVATLAEELAGDGLDPQDAQRVAEALDKLRR
jgi:hypothetical protein